jgi:serine/threonine protein kinase
MDTETCIKNKQDDLIKSQGEVDDDDIKAINDACTIISTQFNQNGELISQLGTFILKPICGTDALKMMEYLQLPDNSIYTQKCGAPLKETVKDMKTLGKGTFGTGYSIDAQKAIKITHSHLSASQIKNEINGFLIQSYLKRELQCSENIIDVYEFGNFVLKGKNHSGAYAILEPFDTSLSQYLKEAEGEHPDPNLKTNLKIIFKGIFEGLQCLHSNDFVHLDIKPDNVGLKRTSNSYITKLFDFGLTQNMKTLPKNSLRGSPGYVDPFYVKSRTPTLKSDIYSVGIILYEIFTEKRVSNDLKTSYQSIQIDSINKIREANLKELIQGCLGFKFDQETENYKFSLDDRFTASQAKDNAWFFPPKKDELERLNNMDRSEDEKIPQKEPQDFKENYTEQDISRRRETNGGKHRSSKKTRKSTRSHRKRAKPKSKKKN